MPLPKTRTILGIAKETTKGTPVVPVQYLPILDPRPNDNIAFFEDKGLRGSAVENYGMVQGPSFSEFEFDMNVWPEYMVRPLRGLMGEHATVGGAAPYTHSTSVLNTGTQQPDAYTLTDFNGFEARAYAGMQFQEITFRFNADGLLECSVKAVGFASVTAATPTPSFDPDPPHPGWLTALTLGGSANTKLLSGELTISRPVTPIQNLDGLATPYAIWAGPIRAYGKLLLLFEDNTDLTRYLTNTQPAMVITASTGAGAAQRSIAFTMSKTAFRDPTNITRGNDWVELDASFEAVANTTDVGASAGYGPVKVAVISDTATYTT